VEVSKFHLARSGTLPKIGLMGLECEASWGVLSEKRGAASCQLSIL
jgi:hypothetical protein